MKHLITIVKKVVVALCMLYTFNIITGAVGFFIPINIISIIFISFLGLPGIFGLIFLLQFV